MAIQTHALGGTHPGAVFGNYTNTLRNPGPNPPVDKSSSAAFYGGSLEKQSTAPAGVDLGNPTGICKLVQSAHSQPVANTIPYPDFVKDALDSSLKLLYYDKADPADRDKAAFRYKVLLYSGTTGSNIFAQWQNMTQYWTDTERAKANQAAALLKNALTYAPLNSELRNALLDIYYDISVAEVAAANERMVSVQKSALGPAAGVVVPPGEFTISVEIGLLAGQQSVSPIEDLYENAVKHYFELLKDPLGVDTRRVDASAPANMPYGYYLFKQLQPQRSLYAPSYKDANGNPKPVPLDGSAVDSDGKPDALFNGYKDLALLYDIESRSVQSAARLARLYAMRSASGDVTKGKNVVQSAQRKAYTDGTILDSVYEGLLAAGKPSAQSKSGLEESRGSWGNALAELSGAKSFLDGDANPLGIDPSFLGLVQTANPGQANSFQDTYSYLESVIFPDGNPAGPLDAAKKKYDLAIGQYDKWQQNRTAVLQDMEGQRTKFLDRLRQITGSAYPVNSNGDPIDVPDDPYNFPFATANSGGEMYIQKLAIERAKVLVDRNRQQIADLQEQINIEIERRQKEHNINNLIGQTYINYGEKQAKLTEWIGAINAAQALANEFAAAEGSLSLNPLDAFGTNEAAAHTANAFVQSIGEIAKGELEAKKERLAAQQNADITYLNDQIADANSEARVKELVLGMNTLAIESLDAALAVQEAVARMDALSKERQHVETRYKEARAELASQWFANPAHRIILDKYIAEADATFRDAQFWVFAAARALQYKRNESDTEFAPTFGGKTYRVDSVFALRNAQELEDMMDALLAYNALINFNERATFTFMKLSLKEDILGFKKFDPTTGGLAYYPDIFDPTKKLNAEQAFKQYMIHVAKQGPPLRGELSLYSTVVRVDFSTLHPSSDNNFFSPDRYNEKIANIVIKLEGGGTQFTQTGTIGVWLEMSGTGYVRKRQHGVFNPVDGSLDNEMVGYFTRFWNQKPTGTTGALVWDFYNYIGFPQTAVIHTGPDLPTNVITNTQFAEWSPAVSNWMLEIPLVLKSNGAVVINLNDMRDVQLWFTNYAWTRPSSKSAKKGS